MEVTVFWADSGDQTPVENHIWSELHSTTCTYEDVANVRVQRHHEYQTVKEPYPDVTIVHEDGSTTRGCGSIVDATGSFGRATTSKYNSTWNSVETDKYDEIIGAWWDSESSWHGGRENRFNAVYKRDDGRFGLVEGVKADYVHVVLPNGDSHVRGESPIHQVDRRVTETGDSLTLEVQDTEGDTGRVIDDVEYVEATTWDVDREYILNREDGSTERVHEILDVDGARYATCRVSQWNGAPRFRTYFDGLGVTEDDDGTINRISYNPRPHHGHNVSVSRWNLRRDEDDETLRVVSPDGAHTTM